MADWVFGGWDGGTPQFSKQFQELTSTRVGFEGMALETHVIFIVFVLLTYMQVQKD